MRLSCIVILSIIFLLPSDVKSQDLSMHPGFWSYQFYEDSERVSKKEFLSTLYQNSDAAAQWQKSKRNIGIAWGLVGVQIGMLVWQYNRRDNGESQTLPLIGNIAAGVTAIGFAISSSNLQRDAVLTYNKGLKETTFIDLGLTRNGAGLVISF